jgi:subtilisin family serine protease
MRCKSFLLIFVFLFVSISFVSSVEFTSMKISQDSGKELSKIFNNHSYAQNLVEQGNFSKIKIEDNQTWIRIKVNLKPSSEVEIAGDFDTDKISKKSFLEVRVTFFEEEINETLNDLLGNEIKLVRRSPEGFIVWVNEAGLKNIEIHPSVERITYSDVKFEPLLQEAVLLVGADEVWNLGYTGNTAKICVIDSGVDSSNSYIYGNVVDEYCYCSDAGGCCPNGENEDDDAEDELDHGTKVIGAIVSNHANYTGISPDADIYIVKVAGEEGEGWDNDDIADAIDWCRNQNVDIISMSFGDDTYIGSCKTTFDTEINNAYNFGIFLDAASGNSNKFNKISYPACNDDVVAVGETYDFSYANPFNFDSCTDESHDLDDITCETNRNSDLDILAPGCIVSTPVAGGAISSDCGTSLSAPLVAGAVALLLEKDPTLTPAEIKYQLQSTGVDIYDGETGLTFKRIDVEEAIGPCECSSWTASSCGGGSCGSDEMYYTRTCVDDCAVESRCDYDVSCEAGSGVSACTPANCDAGFDDEGIDSYLEGNFWTWERTCHDEQLSEWILYSSDSGSGAGWKSDGIVECDDMAVAVPASYEEIVIDSYIGRDFSSGELNRVKWHVDSEGYSPLISSCSSHTSSYSPTILPTGCGGSCTIESYVELFKGEDNCNNLCDNNILTGCDDLNYGIECSADLYYNEYEDVYDNQYCDVPYTSDIDIDSIAYVDQDIDCDVEVQGSESDPEMIKVQWYVNGNRVETQYCDDGSSYNACADYSGYIWANSFDLEEEDSYYEKGDEVYCIARGYGEDGGHGAYVESSVTTVSNRIPTWSSISLSEEEVEGGVPILVTANSENDGDEEMLSLYCCSGASCTPSISNHDFCYFVGDSYPYDLQCTGYSNETDGENTVRCAIYDGDDYSSIKSATYVVNNSLGDVNPTTTLTSPTNNSVDEDGSVVFSCSATDDLSLANITLFGNWNGGWHANETKSLTGTSDSETFTKILPEGIYQWNCLSYDNASQSSFAVSNWTINVTIPEAPANDTHKFYHKNSANENVAWLGSEGNIVLKGTCSSGGSCDSYGDNAIVFGNSTDDSVAYIDSNGNLCLEYGDCSDESLNCNSPSGNSFIVKDSSNTNVIYIDGKGDLCLTGQLYQNSNP